MSGWAAVSLIGPPLAMLVGAGLVLTVDLLGPRGRAFCWPLALLSLLAAAGWALWHGAAETSGSAFGGAVVWDSFALYVSLLLIITTAVVVVGARQWASGLDQAPEFYALVLVAAGSMSLLVQGNDLILIFVALETTSIAQYVLVGITRRDRAAEAGIKYLINGAVAAGLMIYGFAFLFGVTGTTSLDGIAAFVSQGDTGARLPLLLAFSLVAAGFGFKMALVPFHGWAPDVYEGGPTPVVSFLAVASKAGGFAIALRLFYSGLGGADTFIGQDWTMMFGAFAAASMLFGNTAALLQTDARRLLGYSSIAQAGNIGIGLAAGSALGASAVLFFLGTYLATNLGAFLVVIVVGQKMGSYRLNDYAGLIRRSPVVAVVLVLCLLSLTGIPPTAGFIAKVYVFNSAVQAGEIWLVGLVALAVINTAISAFYYLRWARTITLEEPADDRRFSVAGSTQALLAASFAGVLLMGLVPSPLINAAQRAAAALLA